MSEPLIGSLLTDVHTVSGGQSRQGRVGAAERRRHDANGKEHHHHLPQRTRRCEHGQQLIARRGKRHAPPRGQHGQQHAQRQEQQVGGHESKSVGAHVFLRLSQGLARQILLHHVLIEPRHHDDDKDSAHELLPEILFGQPVIKHEDTAPVIPRDGCHCLSDIHVEHGRHLHDDEDEGREHAKGLKRVGPHQGLDASAPRIQPDKRHQRQRSDHERHPHGIEYKPLQEHAHHIKLNRRTRHFG